MTARLQAEPGPEMVEVLLEPPALLRDGGARQASEAGREQPHPDAGRVKVDGREHAIRAHRNLPGRRHETALPRPCQVHTPAGPEGKEPVGVSRGATASPGRPERLGAGG